MTMGIGQRRRLLRTIGLKNRKNEAISSLQAKRSHSAFFDHDVWCFMFIFIFVIFIFLLCAFVINFRLFIIYLSIWKAGGHARL